VKNNKTQKTQKTQKQRLNNEIKKNLGIIITIL